MAVYGTVVESPVDRISAQTREIRAGVSLLSVIAAVLMLIGRIPAYVVTAIVWSAVAVREGYREVRPLPERPAHEVRER